MQNIIRIARPAVALSSLSVEPPCAVKARTTMVYQMPYSDKQHAFVGSTAAAEEARHELDDWASQQGFQPALMRRTFTTYHSGEARDWVLMERMASVSNSDS